MKVFLQLKRSEFNKAAIECCQIFDESENTEIRIVSAVEPAALG